MTFSLNPFYAAVQRTQQGQLGGTAWCSRLPAAEWGLLREEL